jgi:hypothetical protein
MNFKLAAALALVLATALWIVPFHPAGAGPYKCRFFHVSPSSTGNDKLSGEMGMAGQGSGQPWPIGNGR